MADTSRLTAVKVEKLKAPGYHADGDRLYLQISERLTKSWVFCYTLSGRSREMGLGAYPTFSLAEARSRAKAARQLLADGVDPIEHRDALRAQQALQKANSLSFAQCAEKYIAAHRAGWRNAKHVEQWRRTLADYAGPIIGKMPVHDVDTAHILRVLEPIWLTKTETATRLRGRMEQILDWARVQSYRTGENPARWRGHLDKLLPKKSKVHSVKHLAALAYADINAFVTELREQPGIAARAVELDILTAARSGEVRGAKPIEFDLEAAIWTVPAERMKAKKEHRVPLSSRAVEIVRERIKADPEGKYLFPNSRNGKPLSDMALTAVLRRMKRDGVTVHGFRSTFRVWAAECTSYPREMCEFALAHKLPDKVEAAYLRTDMLERRRQLMSDWAKFCNTPKPAGKVLPMKRKKA
jgi:integrase